MANTKHQNKRKFHTIYQTTNLINNKIYIGSHSTDDLSDNYFGSGTNIARAIKKYGKDSFKKDILHIFETPEEMLSKEKEIVNSEFLKRDDVYNIVEGGYGGYNKGSSGLKHLHHLETKERCAVHPNAVDKMLRDGWKLGFLKAWNDGKIYVHKDNKKKVIELAELETFLLNVTSNAKFADEPEVPIMSIKTLFLNKPTVSFPLKSKFVVFKLMVPPQVSA